MQVRKQLPARARLEQLKKQAKDLLRDVRSGAPAALARVRSSHPRYSSARSLPGEGAAELLATRILLADTQLVIAREYGFASWTHLRARVEAIDLQDPRIAFVEAASIPMNGSSHRSGTLARAEAILEQHPEIGRADLYSAALLGDAAAVERFLAADAQASTATGGPYDWDALTYLCFSRFLRLDRSRSDDFLRAARCLLEHGASANTGFYWQHHEPDPTFETAMYGAAACARHGALTRLLLDHGADPNDGETPYHVPEGYDNAVLEALVESGKLDATSLTTMLHRKLDWHDYGAIAWLLDHRANPNEISQWGRAALYHAVERNNAVRFVELLLDHAADPLLPAKTGRSAIALAARMGRADLLELFAQRGFSIQLDGGDALLAACTRADAAAARAVLAQDPALIRTLTTEDPALLADVAGAGNTAAVKLMLDLGFEPSSRTTRAAPDDTALHIAIWRGRHVTAKLLIERGAPLEATNRLGETPLAYAVRAAVDAEWSRTVDADVDLVSALLHAGARIESVKLLPSGIEAIDRVLQQHRNP